MSSMKDSAQQFFDACETGKGWEACQQYCHAGATFSSQTSALAGVTTLQGYTDWMKGMLALMPDGQYEIKSFAVDDVRNNVAGFGKPLGTSTTVGTEESSSGNVMLVPRSW